MNNLKAISGFCTLAGMLVLLSACSGLNLGTASMLQNVDVLNDDVARMRFAIDAPLTVLPRDRGMEFQLDATTTSLGERHIRAVLERGDDILAFSGLEPPANNRTYHLFSISPDDQEKIREMQAWIKEITASNDNVGGELTMQMEMKFCRVGEVDISDMRVSVHISIPGQENLRPLLSNVRFADLGGSQETMPYCVQTQ